MEFEFVLNVSWLVDDGDDFDVDAKEVCGGLDREVVSISEFLGHKLAVVFVGAAADVLSIEGAVLLDVGDDGVTYLKVAVCPRGTVELHAYTAELAVPVSSYLNKVPSGVAQHASQRRFAPVSGCVRCGGEL